MIRTCKGFSHTFPVEGNTELLYEAFIMNKHSGITKEKSRIVFNCKRLHDNIENDKYPLSNKEALINKIKSLLFIVNLISNLGFG